MYRPAALPSLPPASLSQLAADRLRESSHRWLRAVRCEEHEGVLVLRGRVPSYHLKQLAQAIVGKIDGVEKVVNSVEVLDLIASQPVLADRI